MPKPITCKLGLDSECLDVHASVNLSKTINDGLPVNVTLFYTRQIFGLIV